MTKLRMLAQGDRPSYIDRSTFETIYELTYKYQMLKQEAAIGDYGIPQQLPDSAYIEFEKIKNDLRAQLNRAYDVMIPAFDAWITGHQEKADEDFYLNMYDEIQSEILDATGYAELLAIFSEEDIKEVVTELSPDMAGYSFGKIRKLTESSELFDQIKDSLLEHPGIDAVAEERLAENQEDNYEKSAIPNVQEMLTELNNNWDGSMEGLGTDIILFQEAVTTLHNNGPMADHLLGEEAQEFLAQLSSGPYIGQWNNELSKLLGYPVGSHSAPKSDWFISSHLGKAIRMLSAMLIPKDQVALHWGSR